jgi:Uma2 family endonuclease
MTSVSFPDTLEILEAAEHLPGGAALVVPAVPWDEYEHLLEDLAERPHFRVSYDDGRLEIVSPLPEHEEYARLIDMLVVAYAEAHDTELENRGHATWRRKALKKGVEADACYYVRNARRIIGKRGINLELDPPPDIAVEIDTTRQSTQKFHIYAALGIAELWHYDGKKFRIYRLTEGEYIPARESHILPGLSSSTLAEAIEASKTLGQIAALKAFRRRVQAAKRRPKTKT